jgi:uncharacterized protein YjdB
MKKIAMALVFMMVFAFLTPAVSYNTAMVAQASTIKINKKTVTIEEGDSTTLSVTGAGKTIKWSSSKKSVATVSSKGKVIAVKKGTATITATVSNKKYTCKVTVTRPQINQTEIKSRIGWSEKLKVTGTKKDIVWSSSDETIATVSDTGLVTVLEIGECVILAEVGDNIFECKVKVPQPYFKDGATATMGLKDTYKNDLVYESDDTIWSSSNETIATVDSDGYVTAIKEGSTTIMATSGGYKYEYNITVTTESVVKENNNNNTSTSVELPNIQADLFDGSTTLTSVVILQIKNNGNKPLTITSNGYISNGDYDSLNGLVYLFDGENDSLSLIDTQTVASGQKANVWYRTADSDDVGEYYDTMLLFEFIYDGVDYTGFTDPSGYFNYEAGHVTD